MPFIAPTPVPGTARARPQHLQGGRAPARRATAAAWQQGPPSLPQPRARAGVPGPGGAQKTLTHPWRGCNSINEAWPWFSTANKANGPAQAWRCLPGGGVGGGAGGHLLIKWGWGTMEPAVMSPP